MSLIPDIRINSKPVASHSQIGPTLARAGHVLAAQLVDGTWALNLVSRAGTQTIWSGPTRPAAARQIRYLMAAHGLKARFVDLSERRWS